MFASVVIVRAIVAELRRLDKSAELCVDEAALLDFHARISFMELSGIIEHAVELAGDPGLGLTIGTTAPPHMLQLLHHLVLSCRTLRDAWGVFLRYASLLSEGTSWHLLEGEENVHLVFKHECDSPAAGRFAAEFALAMAWRVAAHFMPRSSSPRMLLWRHAAPLYARRYDAVFHCPMRFAQPASELVLPQSALDIPNPHADVITHDLLRSAAEHSLELQKQHVSTSERVRLLLAAAPSLAHLDFESLARRLRFTRQELGRELAKQGLSMTALLNEARCRRACEDLRDGRLIGEIAERVGFSEPSAFHRAFKRWTGVTPMQYRKTAR